MQNAIHLTLFIADSFSHVAASFSFHTEYMDFCIICPKRINRVSFYFISNSSRHRNSPKSSSSASESRSWSCFHLIFWTQHQQQMLPTVGLSLVFILCPLCHFFLLLLRRNSSVVAALSVVLPRSSLYSSLLAAHNIRNWFCTVIVLLLRVRTLAKWLGCRCRLWCCVYARRRKLPQK